MSIETKDDRVLVELCKSGDESAFEALVRKYQQTVFNLIYHNAGNRIDVEDVAQKVFSKIFFSLPKFDSNRPFFPWLYRIVINQCYDELRRLKRRKVFTFTDMNLLDIEAVEFLMKEHQDDSQNKAENNQEIYALLHKLLDQLPKQQKAAVVLRDLESTSYEDIAKIMNCTEQAARLKVFRARIRLRDLLEKALRRKGK